jgi:energy-converting hydrogenase Eha subunit G
LAPGHPFRRILRLAQSFADYHSVNRRLSPAALAIRLVAFGFIISVFVGIACMLAGAVRAL